MGHQNTALLIRAPHNPHIPRFGSEAFRRRCAVPTAARFGSGTLLVSSSELIGFSLSCLRTEPCTIGFDNVHHLEGCPGRTARNSFFFDGDYSLRFHPQAAQPRLQLRRDLADIATEHRMLCVPVLAIRNPLNGTVFIDPTTTWWVRMNAW